MENRKLPKRKEYLNDFKLNEEGKYEYKGLLHELDEKDLSFRKVKQILILIDVLVLCTFIVAGLVQAVGVMNAVYVTMPYVFAFFAIAVLTFKVVMLHFNHYPIRDYDFKATVEKFNSYSMIIIFLTICTLIGELFYIIRYGIEMYLSGTIIFIVCMIVACIVEISFNRFNRKLKWKEMSNS